MAAGSGLDSPQLADLGVSDPGPGCAACSTADVWPGVCTALRETNGLQADITLDLIVVCFREFLDDIGPCRERY